MTYNLILKSPNNPWMEKRNLKARRNHLGEVKRNLSHLVEVKERNHLVAKSRLSEIRIRSQLLAELRNLLVNPKKRNQLSELRNLSASLKKRNQIKSHSEAVAGKNPLGAIKSHS